MMVVRYAIRSSTSASGSFGPNLGNLTGLLSCAVRNRYSTLATPGTRNAPDDRMAAETWMISQYDCSAGWTGAAIVYSIVPLTNIRITTGSSMNPERCRTGNFLITTSQVTTATNIVAMPYSYMLPHGARC